MTDKLEDRLSSLLGAEADSLPSPSTDVVAVVAGGARRRLRARLAGAGCVLALVALGVGFGGSVISALAPEPSETVAAAGGGDGARGDLVPAPDDQADMSDADNELPTIPAQAADAEESAGSGELADQESGGPIRSTLLEQPVLTAPDEPDESSTTTSPSSTTSSAPTTVPATEPPPSPRRRSTNDVISSFADDEILFFSNNDGCGSIDDGRAHPDWMQGQPGSGRNGDGTPTYGFAYNTGDSRSGEISWGFEQESVALSGDCVLRMGIADAYNNRRAVRIFRRYDRNGRDLPSDGYYSMWFYFPEEIAYDDEAVVDGEKIFGFWNVFQIKNKIQGLDGSNETFSALSFNAGKVSGDDHMSFFLWNKTPCGRVEECDGAGSIEQISSPKPIPVGEWVHLELHLVSRSDADGRIEVWQNGEKIYDYTGMTERVGADRINWSVNSYGRLHQPSSHDLFADDGLISTRPVHPLLFD